MSIQWSHSATGIDNIAQITLTVDKYCWHKVFIIYVCRTNIRHNTVLQWVHCNIQWKQEICSFCMLVFACGMGKLREYKKFLSPKREMLSSVSLTPPSYHSAVQCHCQWCNVWPEDERICLIALFVWQSLLSAPFVPGSPNIVLNSIKVHTELGLVTSDTATVLCV